MRKILILKGIDCAECGAKIERKINKLNGVKEVVFNFITSKLIIDFEGEDITNLLDEIKRIIRKYEPYIEIIEG